MRSKGEIMQTAHFKKKSILLWGVVLFLFVALTLHSLPLAPRVYAAEWQMDINVSVPYTLGEGGKASQVVAVGTRVTALDGFDNTWDTVALGSALLSAYAYHPELSPDHQTLARDFRSDSYPKQWDIYIISSDGYDGGGNPVTMDGQPVTLSWNLPTISAGVCVGIAFTLTDVTAGVTVDLLQPSYTYTNVSGTPRQFQFSTEQVVESPPPSPVNLYSPRVGSASVLLAWTGVGGSTAAGYHVYRRDPGSTQYTRLTPSPVTVQKYIDSDVPPGSYAYLVTTVTSTGCESSPSNMLAVTVSP
jgi:hypothetical protein